METTIDIVGETILVLLFGVGIVALFVEMLNWMSF